MKIQWGVESGTKTAGRSIAFPLSTGGFTQKPAVSCCLVNNDSDGFASAYNVSAAGFNVRQWYKSANGNYVYNDGTGPVTWMAIGY